MRSRPLHGSRRSRPATSLNLRGLAASLFVLALIAVIAAFESRRLRTVWAKPGNSAQVLAAPAAPLSSLPAPPPENADLLDLSRLAPQQQAELLLEQATQHETRALDRIRENLPAWQGRLENTDHLFDLVLAALNSDDLRVRVAAVEIDLAANRLAQSPQSVARLVQVIRTDSARRSLALWRLGALGNRGIEPKAVLDTLLLYAHHRNADTRDWAVEGLAMLATNAAIDPLFEILRRDPSPRVRQRAAFALAQSGMFTREQRLRAVPHLLNSLDDDGLDSGACAWVVWTLRTITGAQLGDDVDAWREWWANQGPSPKRSRPRPGLFRI